MTTIHPNTTVNELLKAHPFLVDFLVAYNPKFELLKNKVMRATMGRVATLKRVADIGQVPLDTLLADIAEAIRVQTGEMPTVAFTGAAPPDAEKTEALKAIITDLHDGAPFEEVKQRFDDLIADVDHSEIVAMEQELVKGGLPISEVQRLCDLHVGVFKNSLDRQELPDTAPGHPVHTCMAENAVITGLASELDLLLRKLGEPPAADAFAPLQSAMREKLERLRAVDTHYVRKENQFFPYLEKHGITAPPQVMWGVHDQIRANLKTVSADLEAAQLPDLVRNGLELTRAIVDMVYKENHILLPMCLNTFDEQEWAAIRHGEDQIGYPFASPAGDWPSGGAPAPTAPDPTDGGLLPFDTGMMTAEQANLVLKNLPLDITYVDENDEVRYFSAGRERIFPRSPGIIGRKVQNCHPPKSLDIVNRIVEAFRKGEKDVAEFWIPLHGQFVHIRYFAVRDDSGAYRGVLEVSQELTEIRKLSGERRLLDWED